MTVAGVIEGLQDRRIVSLRLPRYAGVREAPRRFVRALSEPQINHLYHSQLVSILSEFDLLHFLIISPLLSAHHSTEQTCESAVDGEPAPFGGGSTVSIESGPKVTVVSDLVEGKGEVAPY